MNQIWKYLLDPKESPNTLPPAPLAVIKLRVPARSKILSLQSAGDCLILWALVNPEAPLEERVFHCYGTGQELDVAGKAYRATCILEEKGLVIHVFEATAGQ